MRLPQWDPSFSLDATYDEAVVSEADKILENHSHALFPENELLPSGYGAWKHKRSLFRLFI